MLERSVGHVRTRLVGIVVACLVAGCTHHTDAAQEMQKAVAPFTQARDEATALVTTGKHTLGAADLNSLAVMYSALEEKGNAYAGFVIQVANENTFDAQKNGEHAADLTKAIASFNKSFASIRPASMNGANVDGTWVPQFAASVASYWNRYQTALAAMSPEQKAALIKQLKAKTIYPNYENIATQPLGTPSPH
jgi:hypothetical protein